MIKLHQIVPAIVLSALCSVSAFASGSEQAQVASSSEPILIADWHSPHHPYQNVRTGARVRNHHRHHRNRINRDWRVRNNNNYNNNHHHHHDDHR